MKAYRMALLRKEFNFIGRLLGECGCLPKHINDIKVKKGDSALLTRKGSEKRYDWSEGGYYDYTKYFVVWHEGNDLVLEELETEGSSATGGGEYISWQADTIGEQIFTRGIVPEYIVECIQNDTDANGNGEASRFWTIFKMARFDLCGYHQQKIDEAAAVIKAEIAAICA